MNNDNDLNLHLHDPMSGWLRYRVQLAVRISNWTTLYYNVGLEVKRHDEPQCNTHIGLRLTIAAAIFKATNMSPFLKPRKCRHF